MSIVDNIRMPDKPQDESAVYVIVSAGGFAHTGWPYSEKDLPFLMQKPPLAKHLTQSLNELFSASSAYRAGLTGVFGHPFVRMDREEWRRRVVRDDGDERLPRMGTPALKWCLDGVTQRYFALGPMTRQQADTIARFEGPAGIAIVSRAELEAAFSHSDSWSGIHTDG